MLPCGCCERMAVVRVNVSTSQGVGHIEVCAEHFVDGVTAASVLSTHSLIEVIDADELRRQVQLWPELLENPECQKSLSN